MKWPNFMKKKNKNDNLTWKKTILSIDLTFYVKDA